MTKRERMLTAMTGGIPDRVPCSPDTNWTIPQRLAGVPSWDIYYFNNPPIWKAYNDCVRFYGVDGFSHHGYYEIPLFPDTEEIKEIVHHDERQMVVRTTFKCQAGEVFQEETYLRDEPPTPTVKFITDFVSQYGILKSYFFRDVENIRFEKYKEIQADMGDDGVVGLCMTLPTLLIHWRQPMEAAFYDYFQHHELLSDFIRLWTDNLVKIAHKIVEADVEPDFVFFPNSGAITLQSEDIMKEYTLPALKELCDIFHEAGIVTSLHSCGKERALVESAVKYTKLDCIDPLEIPPMGDCNLNEIKKEFGNRIALKGNLHTTEVMLMMSPDEIEKEAVKCLKHGMADGGFILSTGDQCGRNTPDENIFKLVEVCEKYGKYH